MGSALASAFLRAGHRVTVWNRSDAKTAPLVAQGATAAASAAQAQRSAPVGGLRAGRPGAERILACPVASWSTSPPVLQEQARELAERMAGRGVRYVDGGVMTTPPGVGDERSMILYSGDQDAFAAAADLLSALAEPVTSAPTPTRSRCRVLLGRVGDAHRLAARERSRHADGATPRTSRRWPPAGSARSPGSSPLTPQVDAQLPRSDARGRAC